MTKLIFNLDNGDRVPLTADKYTVVFEGVNFAAYRKEASLYLRKRYKYKHLYETIGRFGHCGENELRQAIRRMQVRMQAIDAEEMTDSERALRAELADANNTIVKLSKENLELRDRLRKYEKN